MRPIPYTGVKRTWVCFILALSAWAAPPSAVADSFVVDNLYSSGTGSLFDAIHNADLSTAATVDISFSSSLHGSICLNPVTLSRSMTITGGAGLTIVGAHTSGGALFTITGNGPATSNVVLSSLAITAPDGTGIGIAGNGTLNLNGTSVFRCSVYGIDSAGQLTLNNSTVSSNGNRGIVSAAELTLNNSSVNSNGGNGIDSSAMLTLNNSDVSSNLGAGIHSAGQLTLNLSNVNSNRGSGITSTSTLTLDATSVSSNLGRGISSTGQVSLVDGSILSSNSGDGLFTTGNAIVQDSTFTGNGGNGINVSDGTASVARSTLDNNAGDGLHNNGSADIVNSTLAFNGGDGVNNSGTLTVLNATVADNSEFGIDTHASNALATIENTIIALNTGLDVTGTFNDVGHNLFGQLDPTQPGDASDIIVGTKTASDIGLSDQLQYDGPTRVLELSANSLAIDKAGPSPFPLTDQRGVLRPQPLGGAPDIGAVEYVAEGHPTVGGAPAPLPSPAWLILGLFSLVAVRRGWAVQRGR